MVELLSDRRAKVTRGRTVYYVKMIEAPDPGWPVGEAKPGTYDVDDGARVKRVEAFAFDAAVSKATATMSTTLSAGTLVNVAFTSAGGGIVLGTALTANPVKMQYAAKDPRIVSVTRAPSAPGTILYEYEFKEPGCPRHLIVAPSEADAVAIYDGPQQPAGGTP